MRYIKIIVLLPMLIGISMIAAHIIGNKGPLEFLPYKAGDDYAASWVRIDSFINRGLPKDALPIVDTIRQKATTANNYAQLVKTLLYHESLAYRNEENSSVKEIAETEKEIAKSKFPVKPVLQSLLADMYWSYYQSHRYQILDRTVTQNFQQDDIATWDAAKFANKVTDLYFASLQSTDSLQRTKLDVFDQVLKTVAGSKNYRATLYDFLTWRAINFLSGNESDVTEASTSFTMEDPRYLGATDDFMDINLPTDDTISFKLKALKLLQQATEFQLKYGSSTSLVDMEVKRLQYAYNKMSLPDKDSLYLHSLQQLEKGHMKDSISAMVGLEIAHQLTADATKYNPEEGPQYKWRNKEAVEKCKEVAMRFPETTWAEGCIELSATIKTKGLELKTEQVNIPNAPVLALLDYANSDTIYFRLVDATKLDSGTQGNYNDENFLGKLLNESTLQTWQQIVPAAADYRHHNAEIKIPALKKGSYYVVTSTSPNFDHDYGIVTYSHISISNIGLVERTAHNAKEYFVQDRTTGQPLKNAKVEAFSREYDYTTRTYKPIKIGNYITDAEGYFLLKNPKKENMELRLVLTCKDDRLVLDGSGYYNDYETAKPKWEERTYFFLDRAIYRPGQTVYFKGLVIETESDNNRIKKHATQTVYLNDVNGQMVTTVVLTSNDYGTFDGSFILPNTGLNGTMSITAGGKSKQFGYIDFRVEDYKRPHFEVTFDPIKGSFKLGEKVTVKGKAMNYAGTPVDGATIKYRINRQTYFPYWGWDYWWRPRPSRPAFQVATNTIKTNADGTFIVEFTAVADTKIPEKELPEYSYIISLDVTDQANETQSANTTVKVGVVALHADMKLSEDYFSNDTTSVDLVTENLNGQFEAAKGTIQIFKLVDPTLLLHSRDWNAPDQYTMTEKEFRKDFPHDIYKNEDKYQTWTKGDKVLDIAFDTDKDKRFKLANLRNWKQGKYVAQLVTHDHFGKEVKVTKYFDVIDQGKKEMPLTELSMIKPIKDKVEPGDKASIMIGSSAKDARVLYEVVLKGEVIHKEWLKLDNEKKTIELPIEERYRGNVEMRFTYTTHARAFHFRQFIIVPYSDKELQVKFTTFRDKLLPGAQEEWKVKITGPKGEKVAAEMLASMYDASLDAFVSSPWLLDLYTSRLENDATLEEWAEGSAYGSVAGVVSTQQYTHQKRYYFPQGYDNINYFNLPIGHYGDFYYRERSGDRDYKFESLEEAPITKRNVIRGGSFKDVGALYGTTADMNGAVATTAVTYSVRVTDANKVAAGENGNDAPVPKAAPAPPRTNFAETAFFYPQLHTDSSGNIVFSFKVPESLTRWKFRALAHTTDLKYGMLTKDAVTQKDLMVTTNAPRFLREGDDIELTAKVNSLSDKELSGNATLTLVDPSTNKTINNLFGSDFSAKTFKLPKGQSTTVTWKLHVPEGVGMVTYRIAAEAGNFTDAEENALPILANRMLVTESMPISIKGGQEKTFTMDKLIASGSSTTLTHHKLTLELTSNPAWYAIQALPYLMEYPYECSEQLFNRYYSNSIATYIAGSNPRIKQVFESWKSAGTIASNLEKNADIKGILLEETPWVRQGKDETERKKRLALLFDINKMSNEQHVALSKLRDNQAPNGGWPWFKGMPDNRYITQYVISGLGRLQHMGVLDYHKNDDVKRMMSNGVRYLDARIGEDYNDLVKNKADLSKQQISDIQVQYLYARTFYKDWVEQKNNMTAYEYYLGQAKQYWLQQDKYSQAMIAIILARNNDLPAAKAILKSLQQNATVSEEMGMYWKDNTAGYYWYQAPIETQAMMIEAFSEIGKDQNTVDELRTWLLKQKQVQDWKTTKATSDACYALLLTGSDWLTSTEVPTIMVGTEKVEPGKNAPKAEAGTGYIRTSWDSKEVKSSMGKVTVKKQDKGIAWGSLYWQYFEQLDKITPAKTPLQLTKKLFLQSNTANGPVITPITDKTVLKPGDLVKVRIELRSDRDMDFVQMKDMRASGLEPTDVLSGYHYQGGLGYYQSPRDAATNFFFDRLSKGTYVFEYNLRVSQRGNFSNGITTIQCMYAPEFTAHSEGIRVTVQ